LFIEPIIYSNGSGLYACHSLLEGPLDLEALGFNSPLLNPAVSVHNLRVTTQNWFHSTLCFVQLYCPSWNKNNTRSWLITSEHFVYIKYSRPLCWQFRRLKQWNFALLFTWKTNAMSQTRVNQ